MARHSLDPESEAADLHATLIPGDAVYTVADQYENEWWFKWPGVIVRLVGDRALVEFMGFGDREQRQQPIRLRDLQHLADVDDQIAARVDRILRRVRIPPPGNRQGQKVQVPEQPTAEPSGDEFNEAGTE